MSEVVMASVYGFCGGVRAAVSKAEAAAIAAREEGVPCYLYGDIVHSSAVMAGLEALGAVRIDSPEGHEPGYLVIRAHGIGDAMRRRFADAGFRIIDATCPVVLRNMETLREAGKPVIIGRRDHAEVQALLGCRCVPVIEDEAGAASLPGDSYQAIVQTTLSEKLLASILSCGKFVSATSICNASGERRKALRAILGSVDAVAVAGDAGSANTMELVKIAQASGKDVLLASSPSIPAAFLCYNRIGLTAGASAPDSLIDAVRKEIEGNG